MHSPKAGDVNTPSEQFCSDRGRISGHCRRRRARASSPEAPVERKFSSRLPAACGRTFAMAFSPCLEKSLSNAQITASLSRLQRRPRESIVAQALTLSWGVPQRSNPQHEGTYPCDGCARGRHRIGARRKWHCIALFDVRTGHKDC
jgi:hypothetical protein